MSNYHQSIHMHSTVHFSYDEYDRLTRAYANEHGGVNYSGLKCEMAALKGFIDQLAAASPDNKPEWFPNEDERKRYYLTAYNAYILFHAVSAYPGRHGLWSRLGLFKDKDIILGGRKLTLNDLEHNIIRKEFLDPRIHFALNCGARSCPPLKAGVIPENATENELEEAARRFINDPANVRFDESTLTLYLSKIFDWFEGDFLSYLRVKRELAQPHVAQYVALYFESSSAETLRSTPAMALTIKYLDYDKGLNEE
jgi:hypothetical protein